MNCWLNSCSVELLSILSVCKRIVESEIMIINILGDSIYLELALMNSDNRIRTRHCINLPCLLLLWKDRALPHANTNLHIDCWGMSLWISLSVQSMFLNHQVKIRIDLDALCFVHKFSLLLIISLLFYLLPPLFSLLLHLFNVLQHCGLSCQGLLVLLLQLGYLLLKCWLDNIVIHLLLQRLFSLPSPHTTVVVVILVVIGIIIWWQVIIVLLILLREVRRVDAVCFLESISAFLVCAKCRELLVLKLLHQVLCRQHLYLLILLF